MSGQGQKQEYGDLMLILIIVGVLFFAILSEYFFYYYLYFWRGVVISLGYVISVMPPFINEILFFWGPEDMGKIAGRVVDIGITNKNAYFEENILVYEKINIFFNLLFRPYLFITLIYTAIVIANKKNFNKVYLFIENKKNKRRSVTSIDQLLAQESAIWPASQLMVNQHPELIDDLDEGVWAMSKRPEQFVIDFNLLDEEVNEYDEKFYSLNEERTFKIFNLQMGQPWTGFSNISKVERQLFAIMAPKILRNTKESKEINDIIAIMYSTRKKSMKDKFKNMLLNNKNNKRIDDIINKYKNKPEIQKIINNHFYKKTLFAGLLEAARDDGVLATSEFLWLKTKDRDLWYMLNNVGRKSAFPECSAPWSHFMAEKLLERKVANPMISAALIALDDYLHASSYTYQKIYKEDSIE